MVFTWIYGDLGAPAGVTERPLVSVFWTASINHVLPFLRQDEHWKGGAPLRLMTSAKFTITFRIACSSEFP
jgi:hypothetical protein